MKQISRGQLDRLTRDAAASPRGRMNLNLHAELSDPIQRLAIAMQPETYIRPHRHLDPPKLETLSVIRGKGAVLSLVRSARTWCRFGAEWLNCLDKAVHNRLPVTQRM